MSFNKILKNKQSILIAAVCALAIVTVIAVAAEFASDKNSGEPISHSEFLMDTICTIKIYDNSKNASAAIESAFALCSHYESLFSTTISSSDIYRINHSHGNLVSVDIETAQLLRDAVEFCEISGGRFDITILPLKQLWDFSGNVDTIPSNELLKEKIGSVDFKKIVIDGCDVFLPDGMGIDLGGIAKGYVADKLAQRLREFDISSAVIDLGGNIYVLGARPDGQKWHIGIQTPFAENGEQSAMFCAENCSVVTSGVYQRYFINDGTIYHHILSASTGMPVDSGLYSVTICSNSSEQCDALSTICMLLGYERSVELLKNYPEVSAVFITDSLEVIGFGDNADITING